MGVPAHFGVAEQRQATAHHQGGLDSTTPAGRGDPDNDEAHTEHHRGQNEVVQHRTCDEELGQPLGLGVDVVVEDSP